MNSSELEAQLEKYHRESYGWALSCCARSSAEAEVVLQTAYLKVLEGKARFSGKASFKTWLFSVIRNTASDHRRRRILRKLRLTEYEQSAANIARVATPDEEIYKTEIQTLFERALAALPERQREVLQLVFYHDLSLAEAAEVMKVSLGSARTHYERGKKQVRQLMSNTGIFDESGLGRRENRRAIP